MEAHFVDSSRSTFWTTAGQSREKVYLRSYASDVKTHAEAVKFVVNQCGKTEQNRTIEREVLTRFISSAGWSLESQEVYTEINSVLCENISDQSERVIFLLNILASPS